MMGGTSVRSESWDIIVLKFTWEHLFIQEKSLLYHITTLSYFPQQTSARVEHSTFLLNILLISIT